MSLQLRHSASRIRLVAVDMDGTFLDSSGEYDRERFAALHSKFHRHGVRFVVASGNQYWALRRYFTDYPDVFYIAENGALIGTTEQVLQTRPFSPSDAHRAITVTSQLSSVFTLVCTSKTAYALRSSDPQRIDDLGRYYARIELVDDFSEVHEPILKLALGCHQNATETLLAELGEALLPGWAATSSGHGSIDVIPTGVNKGTALAWLGNQLGIGPSSMVAFGDGGNDLEMFSLVGTSVAMANAPDRVSAVADQTTSTNDDSGVLAWLERHEQLWRRPETHEHQSRGAGF